MTPLNTTPAELGYRWPGEWEPHRGVWIAWPHNRETWPEKFDLIPDAFARLARTIAKYETVNILAGGEEVLHDARRHLGSSANIKLHNIATDDAWCRDFGPIFLTAPDGAEPALVDWRYNAWGEKYPPHENDAVAAEKIAKRLERKCFQPGIVLEGGSIEGNGAGTILTTQQCLLHPNRNGNLSRAEIERYLADFLAAKKILWLSGAGLAGDDTDGHIDQLARFIGPRTVAAAIEEDPADENYTPLQTNLKELRAMTDQDGHPLKIVPLPMPRPKYCQDQRLPASYCNFYIANGAVIVPQFDDPADVKAVETLGRLFPQRKIEPLPALDLIWGLGAFHCLTQQEPA